MYEGVPEEMVMQHQGFLAKRDAQRQKLDRSMAHYPMHGPPDPKWNNVQLNFEGVGMNDDPDAYDRERDRRLTGEIP